MVTLVILSIVLGMVVPLLRDGPGRRAAIAAADLARLLETARQEAVLSSRVWRLSLQLDTGSYHFDRRVDDRFEPVADALFAADRGDDDIEFGDCIVNGIAATGKAAVLLYPTGEQDTLRLTLRAGSEERTVALPSIGAPEVRAP
jgi:type II secretory pathway pseudopilin PulG